MFLVKVVSFKDVLNIILLTKFDNACGFIVSDLHAKHPVDRSTVSYFDMLPESYLKLLSDGRSNSTESNIVDMNSQDEYELSFPVEIKDSVIII